MIPVGHWDISGRQEWSKLHKILVSLPQVELSPKMGSSHTSSMVCGELGLGTHRPFQHFIYPTGHVIGVGQRNLELEHVPSEHRTLWLSLSLLHFVRELELWQLLFKTWHESSLHFMGNLLGHLSRDGQSLRFFRQSPFGHLMGIKEGQLKYSGQSLMLLTQELSWHFVWLSGHVISEGQSEIKVRSSERDSKHWPSKHS